MIQKFEVDVYSSAPHHRRHLHHFHLGSFFSFLLFSFFFIFIRLLLSNFSLFSCFNFSPFLYWLYLIDITALASRISIFVGLRAIHQPSPTLPTICFFLSQRRVPGLSSCLNYCFVLCPQIAHSITLGLIYSCDNYSLRDWPCLGSSKSTS